MSRLPSNVERHPNNPRHYIAYDGRGYAVRVQPVDGDRPSSGWRGIPSHAGARADTRQFTGRTLEAIADKIRLDTSYTVNTVRHQEQRGEWTK